MSNRAQRRAQVARARTNVSDLQKEVRVEESAIARAKRKITNLQGEVADHRAALEANVDGIIEELAHEVDAASQLEGNAGTKEVAEAVWALINKQVDEGLLSNLARLKWFGAETPNAVGDELAKRVVGRTMLRSDIGLLLAFIDKAALDCNKRAASRLDGDALLAFGLETIPPPSVRPGAEEKFGEEAYAAMRARLIEAGWATKETFDSVYIHRAATRAVETRGLSVLEDSALQDELAKLPPSMRERSMRAFMARLDAEQKLIDGKRKARGSDYDPMTDIATVEAEDSATATLMRKLHDDVSGGGVSRPEFERRAARIRHAPLIVEIRRVIDDVVTRLRAAPEWAGGFDIRTADAAEVMFRDACPEGTVQYVAEWGLEELFDELPHDDSGRWLPRATNVDGGVWYLLAAAAVMRAGNAPPKAWRGLFDSTTEKKAQAKKPPVDKRPGWFERDLVRMGVKLWGDTYKKGASDAEVAVVARTYATDQTPWRDAQSELTAACMLRFAAAWAVHAFQRVDTSHTYAAALMCSDADRASLESIELHWKAFIVRVPDGVLVADGRDYRRILVATFDGEAHLNVLVPESRGGDAFFGEMETGRTLADVLAVEGDTPTTEVGRVMVMAKRLVAGLLLALQHQDNFRERSYPYRAGRPGRGEEEPAHRVCLVGKPIQVDCRDSVRRYIKNGVGKGGRKHAPPSVQVLVRGHYRRQVIGIGRSGRKVIWICPFWRGPEDAPILTRPKALGAKSK